MKKFFLLFGFIIFAALLSKGQGVENPGNGREKIKMLEIGYLTKQLQLSSEEAEKFWPLFNKYRKGLREIVTDNRINDELERQQKALDLRKEYRKKFSSVLDAERGPKVYEAEDNFKMMVRKEMQQRSKARQNRNQQQSNKHN